ncbi:MAG: threonine--tRNA ligase [Firmicutes bacterium HGW-Firmicutes-21]|nr:MAG: threonine--tRNA ligase [Firmicutes bacterium HGW-Firmicutes-21]
MENAEYNELHALRHTASHILAQAVKRLYPSAKLAIGPAIENGFYYDFDCETSFTPEVLDKIEKEMKKIAGENLKVERFVLPKNEALELVKDEPYKIELINALPEDEEISFYKQGEFTDLCAGPHVSYTKKVKAFKLTQSTGAYWRGDSKNKMLQRIYGTAFKSQDELEKHLAEVEEAKKRDHNKLGRQLGYFTTADLIGQGLPVILPKGAIVMRTLQRFVEDEEERRGYLQTMTPMFAKRELYKISGHWDHYRDGMFIIGDSNEQDNPEADIFALRPMTCPFQFQAYLAQLRSYRDLPLRYNETSTLFRNESSGEMHGLIRVRQFTLSEGHIACTPDQLESEFAGAVELAQFMLKTLGLDEDVYYRFSKWDENDKQKYIGDAAQWESVQSVMRGILDHLKINYYEADGEAAFYGPKLDIQIKNVHGKEDTLITIQIDFQLAERFGMEYVDKDDTRKFPFVIHRSSVGCYERTLALLIEKYAGAMPVWLAPEQVRLIVISDFQKEYAEGVLKRFRAAGIRAGIDVRNEKLGYKIREAQLEKLPYMLIIGEKERENGTLGIRSRKNGDLGEMSINDFESLILKEITTKEI